jgi:hypothetical protein
VQIQRFILSPSPNIDWLQQLFHWSKTNTTSLIMLKVLTIGQKQIGHPLPPAALPPLKELLIWMDRRLVGPMVSLDEVVQGTTVPYEGVSKIVWIDAVKIVKLTIRPIDHHHP